MKAIKWMLVFITSAAAMLSEYTLHLRQKFDNKFSHSCSKYPFVKKFLSIQQDNNISDFLVFVFEEPGNRRTGAGGGLGDRLGGMITAVAYAIRTNRKLIIQSESTLHNLFRPYPVPTKDKDMEVSWSSWFWLNWEHDFAKNMTTLGCVNPTRRAQFCALDSVSESSQFKVIRYSGNRCYICRWLKLAKDPSQLTTLKMLFGIDWETNLYEVAGCLLRLVLHPSETMWQKVDKFVNSITLTNKSITKSYHYQIGVHFRCGDASFDSATNSEPNPECFWNPSIPWHGTNFGDDHTMDSPIDLASCLNSSIQSLHKKNGTYHHIDRAPLNSSLSKHNVKTPLSSYHNHHNHSLRDVAVFVASDNIHSARQIVSNSGNHMVLMPKEACHIDIKTEGENTCAENTLVQWFTLSLSDFLITQEMEMQSDTVYSDPVVDVNEFKSRSPAPISAFSRYAVTYGLSSHLLRYGNCTVINPVSLSHYTHGNWICLPKMFY